MKRRDVRFATRAEQDFGDIYGLVARASGPARALAYVERIKRFCDKLEYASERGTLREDIRPSLRVLGFERRVTIAFVVEADRVVILRLFYGGQDWERTIENS